MFAGEPSVCPLGTEGAGCREGGLRPSPSPALPGAHSPQFLPPWEPQAASGSLLCRLWDVGFQAAARPPPVCRGLPLYGHTDCMSQPAVSTDVLLPWGGGGPAGVPPDEAEGLQARVVASAVWAERVGCTCFISLQRFHLKDKFLSENPRPTQA